MHTVAVRADAPFGPSPPIRIGDSTQPTIPSWVQPQQSLGSLARGDSRSDSACPPFIPALRLAKLSRSQGLCDHCGTGRTDIAPEVKAQEVEAVVDMGHVRLLDRQIESQLVPQKALDLVPQPLRLRVA
jgi:hypothetical protein